MNMDLMNTLQQQQQQLPPEMLQSLESLEKLAEEFRLISVPLQRLQYSCGYKQCFSKNSAGMLGFLGGGGANQKIVNCLERCEAPLHEFEEACDNRMDALAGQLEQCMSSYQDEKGAMDCMTRTLEAGNLRRIIERLQGDVQRIQQKYSDLE
eukprot:TRINITY_DN81698_c0_g1_i1.p1 TRINITY_DN81698_c0_g1~~TRINITY_DN81698_c0_g1_i1.p1  ORF type:complete len:152 (-),score=31.66 TRINITY_DN81698_c0_g1_i1:42-497(-)